jgi:hypothetical protein
MKKKYKILFLAGKNQYMSHTNINYKQGHKNKKMAFVLLTCFHVFRAYILVLYMESNKLKQSKLIGNLHQFIKDISEASNQSKNVVKWLFNRTQMSFKELENKL